MAASAYPPEKLSRMMDCVKVLIEGIGEDPEREGLRDTPKRVSKALLDMSGGYKEDPRSVMGQAVFHEPLVMEGGGGMVMVRNVDFASTCEATILPFHGCCHLAYLPSGGHVLGLSKLARLVRVFARRLTDQQRLTDQVMAALGEEIGALGAAVVVQARHLSDGPTAAPRVTFATSGEFCRKGAPCWAEFITLLRLHGVTVLGSEPSASGRASDGLGLVDPVTGSRWPPHSNGAAAGSGSSAAAAGNGAASGLAPRLPGILGTLPPSVAGALTMPPVHSVPSAEDLSSLMRVSHTMAQAASEDSDETLEMLADDSPAPTRTATPPAGEAGPGPNTLLLRSPCFACPCAGQMVGAPAAMCGRTCRWNAERMVRSVQLLLRELGEDPSRQGLRDSSERYVASLLSSTSGYERTAAAAAAAAAASESLGGSATDLSKPGVSDQGAPQRQPRASVDLEVSRGPVTYHECLEPSLRFSSQCEHHMLPFYGRVHVAYAVGGSDTASRILSRREIGSLVSTFSRRLQIQERFTHQLADSVAELSGASAVLIVCDASHMCMVARGVEKHASSTITVATRGWFTSDLAARASVLERLLQNAHRAPGGPGAAFKA